jgi:eukaryotic-like serine/threonine-protein kinase
MKCPHCGSDNASDAQHCFACGTLLSEHAIGPGSVIASRYEILQTVGRGGMGTVYKAHDRILDEIVAVKVLRAELASSPDLARRFRQETKLARRVRHPNICGIHEYGEDRDIRYIAMEFVDGVEIRRILKERGRLPTSEAFDAVLQVAEGLQAIHAAGVIHRDLKTANIMRDAKNQVRVMDFGIAKQFGSDIEESTLGDTAMGMIVGTAEYMSPEQARGEKIDLRTDIYALGIVIFEIFTGDVPFRGETPVATIFKHLQEPPPLWGPRAVALPESLRPVLEKALAKDPASRYASAAEMLEALRAARGEAAPPPGATVARPLRLPPRSRSAAVPKEESRPSPTVISPPAPTPIPGKASTTVTPPVPKGPWACLAQAIPPSMAGDQPAIRELLASFFASANPVQGSGLLRLHGAKLKGGQEYNFFALFMGEGLNPLEPENRLGTRTFIAYSSPLEDHLARLKDNRRRVVTVVADSYELGRGVREKILQYRQRHNAVVLPLSLKEVRTAHRNHTLRELFLDRLSDLHTPPDLYATRGPTTDPTAFFGMRRELNDVVTVLQAADAFVIVSGPPGSGKTSLVNMAEYGLENRRFHRIRCSACVPRAAATLVEDIEAAFSPDADGGGTIFIDAKTDGAPAEVLSLKIRLARIARQAKQRGERPILVLEDADWLVDLLVQRGVAEEERALGREVWTSLAQHARSGQLPVLVTSVRGFLLSQRLLGSWENPLASQAHHCSVPPLSSTALKRLVTELAVQMNVEFDGAALGEIHRVSAGNVYVTRLLCSAVVAARRDSHDESALAAVRITRADVREGWDRLASERATFSDSFVGWLGEAEQQVLRIVADHRPRSLRSVKKYVTASSDLRQIGDAVEQLRRMGMVRRAGQRHRVCIPLLEEWVRRNEEPSSPSAQVRHVRFTYLVWGTTLSLLLLGANWYFYGRRDVRVGPGQADGCRFWVQHPLRATEGEQVHILVSASCSAASPPPELALVREPGTVAGAKPSARFPLEMNCDRGECEGELALQLRTALGPAFAFNFESQASTLADLRIAIKKDLLGQAQEAFKKILVILAGVLFLGGSVLTFHEQVRSMIERFVGLVRPR